MTPTPKLRWVEREVNTWIENILQQWWESDEIYPDGCPGFGEWKDVPLEEET